VPRVSGAAGVGFRVPGVYERFLRAVIRQRYQLDPRVRLADWSEADEALWSWLSAELDWRVDQEVKQRLADGSPFEVPRIWFGGRSLPRRRGWPEWLGPFSDVEWVRVHADDRVEPA